MQILEDFSPSSGYKTELLCHFLTQMPGFSYIRLAELLNSIDLFTIFSVDSLPLGYAWTSQCTIAFWFLCPGACSSKVHLGWVQQRGSLHTEIGGSAVTFESSSSPDNHETCGEPR